MQLIFFAVNLNDIDIEYSTRYKEQKYIELGEEQWKEIEKDIRAKFEQETEEYQQDFFKREVPDFDTKLKNAADEYNNKYSK